LNLRLLRERCWAAGRSLAAAIEEKVGRVEKLGRMARQGDSLSLQVGNVLLVGGGLRLKIQDGTAKIQFRTNQPIVV
jgi:hypothetical protein